MMLPMFPLEQVRQNKADMPLSDFKQSCWTFPLLTHTSYILPIALR